MKRIRRDPRILAQARPRKHSPVSAPPQNKQLHVIVAVFVGLSPAYNLHALPAYILFRSTPTTKRLLSSAHLCSRGSAQTHLDAYFPLKAHSPSCLGCR